MSLKHLYEPYPEPEPLPICPVCGEECETIYIYTLGDDVLGCENCVSTKDAWEMKTDGNI